MIPQKIKAKYLRAGYKVLTADRKIIRITLIKKIENSYLIKFETGAEITLMENEDLMVTFEKREK